MAKTELGMSGLRPLYSFDQLVIGPNNHVAAGACMEVSKSPGEAYNPLFIYGPSGVGKTHLMQAVAHKLLEQNPQAKIRYLSAERFISEVLMAVSEDRIMDLRRQYSLLDLLILDDVQYLIESKVSQEELFHIFNNMHQENHQVILAADRPPNQLTDLNKNIRSRLEWGLAADVQIPDEPTRMEILRKKQAIQGLQLPDDLLAFVARALRSNVRELEGFLKRLHAYVTLSHQQVNVTLVKSVVREILPEGMPLPDENGTVANGTEAPYQNGHLHRAAPPEAPAPPPVARPAPPPQPPPPVYADPPPPAARPAPPPPAYAEPPPPAPVARPAPPPPPPPTPIPDVVMPTEAASNLSFDLLLQSINVDDAAPPAPPPAPPPIKAAPPPPPSAPARPAIEIPPEMIVPASPAVAATAAADVPEIAEGDESDEGLPPGHKEVGAVFFFPEGKNEALESVHQKFQDVIKKHKLKFRLRRVHSEPYAFKGKVNYSAFVDVCKVNKVPVAIVIGPPPDTFLPEQDFYDLLTVTLDVQGVSLQLVNWGEINKDYRYLNLALDIALVRSR